MLHVRMAAGPGFCLLMCTHRRSSFLSLGTLLSLLQTLFVRSNKQADCLQNVLHSAYFVLVFLPPRQSQALRPSEKKTHYHKYFSRNQRLREQTLPWKDDVKVHPMLHVRMAAGPGFCLLMCTHRRSSFLSLGPLLSLLQTTSNESTR